MIPSNTVPLCSSMGTILGWCATAMLRGRCGSWAILSRGERGTNAGPGAKLETRPNYFNNVHGVGVQ